MAGKKPKLSVTSVAHYEAILADVVALLDEARRFSARAVNAVMTTTYWRIGRRIVEAEMGGKQRADYGDVVLTRLAQDLTRRFGRGFSKSNVYQMRAFYLAYRHIFPDAVWKIRQHRDRAANPQFGEDKIADGGCNFSTSLVSLRPPPVGRQSPGTKILRDRIPPRRMDGQTASSPDRQPVLRTNRVVTQ